MGRKDSPGAALPLEDYRRKIGKQEYKKNKKELKEQKRQADVKKSSSMFQDLILMVLSFVALAGLVYFLLYIYLKDPALPDKDEM